MNKHTLNMELNINVCVELIVAWRYFMRKKCCYC